MEDGVGPTLEKGVARPLVVVVVAAVAVGLVLVTRCGGVLLRPVGLAWGRGEEMSGVSKTSIFGLFLSNGLNRISLAPTWKCLLGYSFFDQSDPNSIQSNSNS